MFSLLFKKEENGIIYAQYPQNNNIPKNRKEQKVTFTKLVGGK